MVTLFIGYLHKRGVEDYDVFNVLDRFKNRTETFDDIFLMQDFCRYENLGEADVLYILRG